MSVHLLLAGCPGKSCALCLLALHALLHAQVPSGMLPVPCCRSCFLASWLC
jgi:hypothetical protein